MDETLRQMSEELASADSIYHPIQFWANLGSEHEALLRDRGLENIKITLNRQYMQFEIHHFGFPMIQEAIRKWPLHFSAQPLLNVLENPEVIGGEEAAKIYSFYVGLLWEYALTSDPLNRLAGLSEPLVGNPIRIRRGSQYISQDLFHSYSELSAVLSQPGVGISDPMLKMGELGAGYGRVAQVFGSITCGQYLIFDIPPALFVSQWYLSQVFPDCKVFRFRRFKSFGEIEDELATCKFGFFTANQLELFPEKYFTGFANINSFHEMRLEQIQHYLQLIGSRTRSYVYVKNLMDTGHAGIRVQRHHYPLPEEWECVFDRACECLPDFFERLSRRRGGV